MFLRTQHTRIARAAVAAAAAATLLVPGLLAPASATAPDGSRGEVILETKDASGQPYNASLDGWWGHEGGKGPDGVRPTYVSMDASDGKGVVNEQTTQALHKALGDGGSFDSIRVAFVPFSADGSNERPEVSEGENAGEAFRWFTDQGFGGAFNGTRNPNDSVATVSTLDEFSTWWKAGRPLQGFDDDLNVLDIANDGKTTPAGTPQGASLLDRWPAGTKISLVFYVSDGFDKDISRIPTVKVGSDGRAMTSWLTFETVADPADPTRSSAGYKVLTGAGTGPKAAHPPVVNDPNGDPSAGASPGSNPTAAGDPAASGSSNSSTGSDRAKSSSTFSRVTDALPGGAPTFWILLVLVIGGGVALVTARMRTQN